MALLGTIVNTIAIIVGSILGSFFTKIPEKIKVTVTHGMALAVVVLGIEMGFKSHQFLYVIGSLAIGGIIGEVIDLDGKLNHLGLWLERKVGNRGGGNVAKAFVTATLVYVIGALAIVGALDSGLRGNNEVLYTKAMLDGFFSVIFATTLGYGVIFSAIPVFLYEGIIALFATQIDKLIPNALMSTFINEMTSTGGILIFAIGLNLLNLTRIKTANLLPSIVVVGILVSIVYYLF